MKQRDLTMFRKLLNERRQELLVEANRTVGGMNEGPEQFPDPSDRASQEGDRSLELRIRDRERKLITKIDEAIGRIEDGSYGKCEECGGDIGDRAPEGASGHHPLHRLQVVAGGGRAPQAPGLIQTDLRHLIEHPIECTCASAGRRPVRSASSAAARSRRVTRRGSFQLSSSCPW